MELSKVWDENKKAIITTVLVVVVGLLVIKFFDLSSGAACLSRSRSALYSGGITCRRSTVGPTAFSRLR